MNRLERSVYSFVNTYRNIRAILGTRKELPVTFSPWLRGRDRETFVNYDAFVDEGYKANEIVYACISLVAQNAAKAPMRVWRRENGARVLDPDHRLNQLLEQPNPDFDMPEYIETWHTFLNLEGNAFTIRVGTEGETRELYSVRPDRMIVVPAERDLLGYVYKPDMGTRIPFEKADIIHMRMPNPGDPLEGYGRGYPPLGTAARETDLDNKATSLLGDFFDNAAIPYGIFTAKNVTLTDDQITEIRYKLRKQHAESGNWFETMILDADAEWQQVGANIDEIAWPDLRQLSEARICMAFKVPPIMIGAQVGLERSTYENTAQAERFLWIEKILPDNKRLTRALNVRLRQELGEDRFIDFDYGEIEALQDSRTDAFARADQGVSGGWLTVNEARGEVGHAPVDGGDIFLRPLMMQPVEAPKSSRLLPMIGFEPGITVKLLTDKKLQPWELIGEAVHKQSDLINRAWESRFSRTAREEFERERRELVAELSAKSAKQIDDPEGLMRRISSYLHDLSLPAWARAILPNVTGLLNDQAEGWAATFDIAWDQANPEVQLFLEDYSFQFAKGLTDVSENQIRSLISQATDQGWSIRKLTGELEGMYEGWDRVRAEMIARTETIRASNAGATSAFQQAGIQEKRWFTARDGDVCPFCRSLHGKVVGVSDLYFSQGETFIVELPEQDGINWLGATHKLDEHRYIFDNGIIDTEQKRSVSMTLSYEDVGQPPLHPFCRCTILPITEITAADE